MEAEQQQKPRVWAFRDGPFVEVWEVDEEGLVVVDENGYADKRFRTVVDMRPVKAK